MTTDEAALEPRDGERRHIDRRAAAEKTKQKKGSSIWIILSFSLTAMIIGWGFSLPFRKHERPLLMWEESDIPGRESDGARKVRLTKEEADAYREAAIQRDREFLRERRERLRQSARLPGAEDAKKAEENRIASVKRAIARLRDAPQGSLEEQYRKELENSLDLPQ